MTAQTVRFPLELPWWRSAKPYLVSLAQLVLRVALAVPFFRSGLTKWDGFLNLSDSADSLFSDEFRLHLFGAEYPLPAPHQMAFASGCM